jgi:excisionase family DNA binding protein
MSHQGTVLNQHLEINQPEESDVRGLPSQNLLTTSAVATWLGISPRTVCLWAECQEIPAIKLGRQWRFRESDLRRWLEDPASEKLRLAPQR